MKCKICGKEDCKKHTMLLGKTEEIKDFSGSSPPEIFVGRWNYPNVYTGILSPKGYGDTGIMSSPEEWHKNNLSVNDILSFRNKLIYGRKQGNIKRLNDEFSGVMKEIAMAHKSGIETSNIIKILSAGLLGLKKNRKLVPTRWAISSVDSTLSKEKLKRIRLYPEIANIEVFNAEYLGNHYEFLLLPDKFSFEVIEISLKSMGVWQDYEGFFGRKKYADSVTGAYYVNRLAL